MNITTLFTAFQSEYDGILSEDKTMAEKDVCVRHGIEVLQLLKTSDLYSKNETIEEMNTLIIPLLNMEYFIAKLMLQYGSLKHRMNRLGIAKKNFCLFLNSVMNLNVLELDEIRHIETLLNSFDDTEAEQGDHGESTDDFHGTNSNIHSVMPTGGSNEIRLMSGKMSPEESRAQKIANFKKKKELTTRFEYLKRKVGGKSVGDSDKKGSIRTSTLNRGKEGKDGLDESVIENNDDEGLADAIEADEDLRMLYIVSLQLNVKDALEELNLLTQEMDMLKHMDALRSNDAKHSFSDEKDSSLTLEEEDLLRTHAQPGIWEDLEKRANLLLLPGKPSLPPKPEDSCGIEVTRTGNVNGEIVFARETVKANVFVPSMESWSMTVEEFGELELQRAKERDAEQKAQIEANKGDDTENLSRRMSQLEADGDEDNARLVEAAVYNDREWDAWKEANPKGSGNKMGKRF